jgi:hypothetical protein
MPFAKKNKLSILRIFFLIAIKVVAIILFDMVYLFSFLEAMTLLTL